MKIKESLITRIDLEKLADILKEGKEEFKEKRKKLRSHSMVMMLKL